MKLLPVMLLLAVLSSAQVDAASDAVSRTLPESLTATSPCMTLMTELECSQHMARLAQLGAGPARERYLAEHALQMQERESACSCNREIAGESVYPARRQALLRL